MDGWIFKGVSKIHHVCRSSNFCTPPPPIAAAGAAGEGGRAAALHPHSNGCAHHLERDAQAVTTTDGQTPPERRQTVVEI